MSNMKFHQNLNDFQDDRIKQVGPIIENFKVQANGGSCDMIYQLIVSKFDESKDYGEYECILENGPWTLDSATIKSDEVLSKIDSFQKFSFLSHFLTRFFFFQSIVLQCGTINFNPIPFQIRASLTMDTS